MSFNIQARIANDQALLSRVAACAASVGIGKGDDDHPVAWANNKAWALAASDGWAEAYAASTADDPGTDETAITDTMIAAAVQEIRATQTESPA